METLNSPSIQIKKPLTVNCATAKDSWMTPIIQYLKDSVLPKDNKKSQTVKVKSRTLHAIRQSTLQERILDPASECVDLE